MIGLLLCSMLAAPAAQSFYITWSSRTDTPAKKGESSSEADAWVRSLGNFVAIELDARYPCGTSTTQSDVDTMVDHERRRQLLGGDPTLDFLASLAGSMGAKSLVYLTVTQTGGSSTVTAVVVDSSTAKATSRKIATIPVNNSAADALQQFARLLAESLTGTVPRCPGKDWAGAVAVSYQASNQGKDGQGKPGSEEGSGTLSCKVTGDGDQAKCTYNSSYTLRGSGGAMTTTKVAKDAPASVSASLAGGKFNIHIGSIPVTVTTKVPGIDIGPFDDTLTGEGFDLPAGSNPDSQSGSWNAPVVGGMKITVTWSFTRAPARR